MGINSVSQSRSREDHLFGFTQNSSSIPGSIAQARDTSSASGRLQYIYDFGVSDSEKELMPIINNFISSARAWTYDKPPSQPTGPYVHNNPQHWWFNSTSYNFEGEWSKLLSGPGSLLWARTFGAGIYGLKKRTDIAFPNQARRYTYKTYSSRPIDFVTDWHDFVLSPDQNDQRDLLQNGENSDWVRNVETAIIDVTQGIKPYISLLDLNMRS